jgi:hypothetical protein
MVLGISCGTALQSAAVRERPLQQEGDTMPMSKRLAAEFIGTLWLAPLV